MQFAMSKHIFRIMLVYLDDLLVYTETFAKQLDSLKTVFQRLREIDVKLNPSKCQFAQTSVKFLGHKISASGIATDDGLTRAIRDFPTPTTLKQVRSFVGLAGYYRRFVKDFAKIARPLHSLITKVHEKFPKDASKGEKKPLGGLWTEECDRAFTELRHALSSPGVLAYADYSKPFILETDACEKGLGAVLSQKGEDGVVRVVAYASRTIRKSESNANYSSLKLELLALKWAITEKFRGYLLGNQFVAYTDNNALVHLKTAKLGAIEQRWIGELQAFRYEVKYRPRRENQNADALSRNPVDPPPKDADEFVAVSQIIVEVCQDAGPTPIPLDVEFCQPVAARPPLVHTPEVSVNPIDVRTLVEQQRLDPDIASILPFVKSQRVPSRKERGQIPTSARPFLRQLTKLHLVNGVLEKKGYDPILGETSVVVVPATERAEAFHLAHDQCAHQGAERTLQILAKRCYWPHMQEFVKKTSLTTIEILLLEKEKKSACSD